MFVCTYSVLGTVFSRGNDVKLQAEALTFRIKKMYKNKHIHTYLPLSSKGNEWCAEVKNLVEMSCCGH